jgi:hypothetical protein
MNCHVFPRDMFPLLVHSQTLRLQWRTGAARARAAGTSDGTTPPAWSGGAWLHLKGLVISIGVFKTYTQWSGSCKKKLGKNRDSIFSRCWLTVNKKISWAILAAIVPPMLDATQDGPSTSFHWFRGLEQGSKCANLRSQVEYPGNPNSIYLEISFLWKPARAVLVAAPGPVRLQAFPWCPSS